MQKIASFFSVLLYDLGIHAYLLLIRISAFMGHQKAKQWIAGRREQQGLSAIAHSGQMAWFHFASLGEFEQGRSVLEKWKELHPEAKITITFFSPSGYEVRKNYSLADQVLYLPIDTLTNAKEFIQKINPSIVFFTKYEYWYHYYAELKQRGIPLYVISAIFRPEQVFFKWYGALYRDILAFVSHIFVQDEKSKQLLKTIGNYPITVSGDTRFDRVLNQVNAKQNIPFIKEFIADKKVLIAGSTWSEDEALLVQWIDTYSANLKYIIAPHELKEDQLDSLLKMMGSKAVRYSVLKNLSPKEIASFQVLIIDNIGMLSSLYAYANIALIGGGFGKGIHNTLEAAAFGLPVIFGPNYQKFNEAKELIKEGGAFNISSYTELELCLRNLLSDENQLSSSGTKAASYVQRNAGATGRIISEIYLR